MAYIIAHGTVDGYRKIKQGLPIGTEQNVLTDIRVEFDNTTTMLNKPCGYLIQMAENGVWISIVKLLLDGERSGKGPGFFAFSAFLPTNQVVEGRIIKQTLDNLLEHYLARIGDDSTKNVGIDWSFVEQASASLNEQCRKRNKFAKTNYYVTSSNEKKIAYIDIHSDAEIEQYLDKPFQPEYGEYRAVFLGTHLQYPDNLATQTPLTIDFENEEYEIIWTGDKNAYPDVYLPQSIRKKEIQTKILEFKKECYKCQTLRFAEGEINSANATLTLEIPKLEPIEYGVQFSINRPEKVVSITATLPYNPPRQSDDNRTLKFYGEEARSNWHVVIKTTPNFETYERDIFPFDDATIPNGIGITLQEQQIVSLQILLDGEERTSTEKGKIQIFNQRQKKAESQDKLYNKAHGCIEVLVPIDKTLEDLYSISLFSQYTQKYECRLNQINETFYQVVLTTRKNEKPIPPPNNREIKVMIPNSLTNHQVLVSDGSRRWNINSSRLKVCEKYSIYHITCDEHIARVAFSFSIDGKQLRTEEKDDDTIIIIDFVSFAYLMSKWIRNYYQYVMIGVLSLLTLTVCTLFALAYFDIVDIKSWFARNHDTEMVSGRHYSKEYLELDSVYQIQQRQWNCKTCKSYCEKYDMSSDTLRCKDSIAYVRLKQLSWLWRTREKIEKKQWNHLTSLINEGQWRSYATDTIRCFLLQIINQGNGGCWEQFGKRIEAETTFENKSFNDVAAIWEQCKKQPTKSTVDSSQNNSTNNHSSRRSGKGGGETASQGESGNNGTISLDSMMVSSGDI